MCKALDLAEQGYRKDCQGEYKGTSVEKEDASVPVPLALHISYCPVQLNEEVFI